MFFILPYSNHSKNSSMRAHQSTPRYRKSSQFFPYRDKKMSNRSVANRDASSSLPSFIPPPSARIVRVHIASRRFHFHRTLLPRVFQNHPPHIFPHSPRTLTLVSLSVALSLARSMARHIYIFIESYKSALGLSDGRGEEERRGEDEPTDARRTRGFI